MIRKNVHGSKVLNTELKTKIFVKSALKAVDHKYTDFKYFVVLEGTPPIKDLDFPKQNHIVLIRWQDQYVLCSDVVLPIQKWMKRHDIEPRCILKQEDMKRLTQRHKSGTYRQYSNNTLENRRVTPDQHCYDPLLDRAQQLMDKYNIKFSKEPRKRKSPVHK